MTRIHCSMPRRDGILADFLHPFRFALCIDHSGHIHLPQLQDDLKPQQSLRQHPTLKTSSKYQRWSLPPTDDAQNKPILDSTRAKLQ